MGRGRLMGRGSPDPRCSVSVSGCRGAGGRWAAGGTGARAAHGPRVSRPAMLCQRRWLAGNRAVASESCRDAAGTGARAGLGRGSPDPRCSVSVGGCRATAPSRASPAGARVTHGARAAKGRGSPDPRCSVSVGGWRATAPWRASPAGAQPGLGRGRLMGRGSPDPRYPHQCAGSGSHSQTQNICSDGLHGCTSRCTPSRTARSVP